MNTENRPDVRGYFGEYGGRFVPETLMAALDELEHAYREACADESFTSEFQHLCREYIGRPTPLYYARQLSQRVVPPGDGVQAVAIERAFLDGRRGYHHVIHLLEVLQLHIAQPLVG